MTSQQFFEKYGLGWLYRICLHVPILLATCCTMSPPIKLTIMITRSYILCNDSGIAQRSNGPLYWNMPLGIVSNRKHRTWNSDRRCIYLCFTYHLLGSSWRPALAQTILRFVDVVVMQPFVHCDVYIVLTSFKASTVCQTARFVDFFSKYSFGIVPLFVNITSVDTELYCPKGKCGCQYFILLILRKKKSWTQGSWMFLIKN